MIFGVAVFWVVVIFMLQTPTYKTGEEALEIIKQCEKDIARNKKCELFAKPVDSMSINNEIEK